MKRLIVAGLAAGLLVAGSGTAVAVATVGKESATAPRSTVAVAAHAKSPAAQATALFNRWNASLATGDPETVADQYAADAVLLPTVDGKVHDTRAEIVEYFVEFLALHPRGTLVETHTRVLDPNALAFSGLYDFGLTRDGRSETIHARFTYVFQQRHGGWKIVEHHSSKKP